MNSGFSKFLELLRSNSGFRASLKKEENLARFWLYLRVKVYCMRWRTSARRCVNKTMEEEKTLDDRLTDLMVKHNDPETHNEWWYWWRHWGDMLRLPGLALSFTKMDHKIMNVWVVNIHSFYTIPTFLIADILIYSVVTSFIIYWKYIIDIVLDWSFLYLYEVWISIEILCLSLLWFNTIHSKWSAMNEERKKKKPTLIHPRNRNIFECPIVPSKKNDTQIKETFIKNVDSKEEWDEMLETRSKMTVIEV